MMIFKTLLTFFIAAVITTGFQAQVIEQRSPLSRVYEGVFRWNKRQTPVYTQAIHEAAIPAQRIRNQAPVEPPFYFYRTTVSRSVFATVPVFTFTPDHIQDERVILYLSGGSYINPPSAVHFPFLDRLADRLNMVIHLPVYHRAPNVTHPVSEDILIRFYQALRADHPVILMGDSAGGGFVLGLTHTMLDTAIDPPERIITLAPWLDITLSNPDVAKVNLVDPFLNPTAAQYLGDLWRGETAANDPRVSPLFADFSRLEAPILTMIGTYDVLYPDTLLLKEKAREWALDYHHFEKPKMAHVYMLYPFLEEAKEAFEIIVEFIGERS